MSGWDTNCGSVVVVETAGLLTLLSVWRVSGLKSVGSDMRVSWSLNSGSVERVGGPQISNDIL